MRKYQVSKVIAKLLDARGLNETRKMETFISPNISQLHDPFLIKNMDRTEKRIIKNIVFLILNDGKDKKTCN